LLQNLGRLLLFTAGPAHYEPFEIANATDECVSTSNRRVTLVCPPARSVWHPLRLLVSQRVLAQDRRRGGSACVLAAGTSSLAITWTPHSWKRCRRIWQSRVGLHVAVLPRCCLAHRGTL